MQIRDALAHLRIPLILPPPAPCSPSCTSSSLRFRLFLLLAASWTRRSSARPRSPTTPVSYTHLTLPTICSV
eukprot:122339-Rhodomonas_salina.3